LKFIQFELVGQLVMRDLNARFKGTILGAVWSLVLPLLTLSMYVLVFGIFMKAKWPGVSTTSGFATILFCGIIVHLFFSECLNRSASLIFSQPNYVKKVVFPLEQLIWVPIGSAAISFALSVLVLLAFKLVSAGTLSWTVVFLPLVFLPLAIMVAGLGLAFSALGAYFRDLAQILPLVTQALMFLSPILYPIENVPREYHWILYLNPLTLVVDQVRRLVIEGGLIDFLALGQYSLISLVIFFLGLKLFQFLRPGFADVV
jgi:lipopolysaccharide transport system permease protein